MTLLMLGVLLWATVHFIPSRGQNLKQGMIAKLGEGGYKGLFSLALIAALAMIIIGWRSIEEPAYYYFLPAWSRHVGMLLVLVAFFLFAASNRPTRIRRMIRHPQLSGVLVWALAHLLMNGDSRSIVLFGGLGLWAILEIISINARDGEWNKPDAPGWGAEVIGAVITLAVFVGVAFAHPWIAGVAIR